MAITEESRMNLHRRLQEVLGEQEAATFMELVPPVGWADVATKRDLDHSEALTAARIDALDQNLRSQMAELGSDLRSEMAELGSDLRSEMAELGSDLRSEMSTGFAAVADRFIAVERGMRLQLLAILGFNLTFFAGAIALFER